jgi:pentatricopeptide repeat protein
MEAAGVARDAFTYTSLLHACQHSGRWQQAMEWFEELETAAAAEAATAARVPGAGAASAATAATAAARGRKAASLRRDAAAAPPEGAGAASGGAEEAPGGTEEAPAPRLVPNVVHYTTLMSVLQRAGRWEQAMAVFERMEAAGVEPDVQAYNAAITTYAKVGSRLGLEGLPWAFGGP